MLEECYWQDAVDWMFMCLQNSCRNVIANVMFFESGAFGRWWGYESEDPRMGLVPL